MNESRPDPILPESEGNPSPEPSSPAPEARPYVSYPDSEPVVAPRREGSGSSAFLDFWKSAGTACVLSFGLGFLSASLLANRQGGEGRAPEYAATAPASAPVAVAPQNPQAAPDPSMPPGFGSVPPEEAKRLVADYEGIAVGSRRAPVTLYEFIDYQCPACAGAALQFIPEFKRRYVDTGKVRLVYVDFPLIQIHPHAVISAKAARCAHEQEKFYEYQERLFATQNFWSGSPTPPREHFVSLAEETGLNRERFARCLDSNKYEKVIMEGYELAPRLGVGGTPTFFLEGRPVNGGPNVLIPLIEQAISRGS